MNSTTSCGRWARCAVHATCERAVTLLGNGRIFGSLAGRLELLIERLDVLWGAGVERRALKLRGSLRSTFGPRSGRWRWSIGRAWRYVPPRGGGGCVRGGTRSTPRVQASRFELKKSVGLALRRDRLFAASTPPGSGRHGSWRHGGRGPSADRHCARTVARRHGIGRGWCGAGEARAPARCCSPPEPQGVRALSPSAASAGPPPRVIEPLGSSAARSSAAGAEDLHSHR